MPQQITLPNRDSDGGDKPSLSDESSVGNGTVPAKYKREPSKMRTIVLLCVLFTLLALMFGFTTNFIPSNSMEPTLNPGDHILTMRRWLAYPFGSEPKPGDIIVFKLLTSRVTNADNALGTGPDNATPEPKVQVLIKRVIAAGGDKVRITDNKVFVNDIELHEDHAITPITDPGAEVYEYADNEDYRVQRGQLFVLGDNRDTSEDSRFWGPLDSKDVIGRFVRVVYNEGKNGPNLHRDPKTNTGQ